MTPIARLAALFAGNDTHYGTHGEPVLDSSGRGKWSIRPSAETVNGQVTEKLWKEHATEGSRKPLGIVPIRTDNATIWGSIDYDVYDTALTDLIKKVEALKLPLVPCRSKSGGLHLFMFVTEPVPAKLMQNVLRSLAAELGIAGSEIFPKQTELLSDRGDRGSWMIMPYFGGDFGGKLKMQFGMRNNGGEVSLSEFVRIAEKAKQTPDQLLELGKRVHGAAPASSSKRGGSKRGKKGTADEADVPFGDGPPCLTLMMREGGIKPGGQNDTLFHMGVYFKKKFPDTWREELEKANATCLVPAGSQEGLDSVVRSLSRTDYEYKCKSEPMFSHCDAITCRKKTYGVTGGSSGAMVPIIGSIAKMNSEPPVWFVEVEQKKIECTTEDLQQWNRFQRILMEKLHNPFGVIPQPVWLAVVQEAMSKKEMDIVPVSEDVQEGGSFRELLETYLTNRQRGENEEDLLSGRPWEDQDKGRFYFQISKLMRYLEREGMKTIKTPQVVTKLREMNKGEDCHETREIKGKLVRLHFVPSTIVQATPKISTPQVKGKPI